MDSSARSFGFESKRKVTEVSVSTSSSLAVATSVETGSTGNCSGTSRLSSLETFTAGKASASPTVSSVLAILFFFLSCLFSCGFAGKLDQRERAFQVSSLLLRGGKRTRRQQLGKKTENRNNRASHSVNGSAIFSINTNKRWEINEYLVFSLIGKFAKKIKYHFYF